jgi:hypothetical protein
MTENQEHSISITAEAVIELQTLAFGLGMETQSEMSLNDALLIAVRAYRALTHTTSLFDTNSKN